jgi:hypothetical protein
MRSADPVVTIEIFQSPAAMPPDTAFLLTTGGGLFATRAWWDTVLAAAMPPDLVAQFALCRMADRPVALFPMARDRHGGGFHSLTTPYTCLFAPSIDPGLPAPERLAVFQAFGRLCRAHATTRLDAMPAEWDAMDPLVTGARQAGLAVRRFDHFGNWYEDVAGKSWADYLAQRPGALRETVRRRLQRAGRLPDARFTVVTGADGLEDAVAGFEAVYARSWKEPEPFPLFNVALIRAASAAGTLRLGQWDIGGVVVASQFWVVEGGKAIVLKLAHDEALKAHSPGTVLTALMLRRLLDEEHVAEIDFGRGDDPYKQGWARARRQRIGLMLFNPLRPAGLAGLARHAVGRLRAAIRDRRRGGQEDVKDGHGESGSVQRGPVRPAPTSA